VVFYLPSIIGCSASSELDSQTENLDAAGPSGQTISMRKYNLKLRIPKKEEGQRFKEEYG